MSHMCDTKYVFSYFLRFSWYWKLKNQAVQMVQFSFYTRTRKNLQDCVQRLLFVQFIKVIGLYETLPYHGKWHDLMPWHMSHIICCVNDVRFIICIISDMLPMNHKLWSIMGTLSTFQTSLLIWLYGPYKTVDNPA